MTTTSRKMSHMPPGHVPSPHRTWRSGNWYHKCSWSRDAAYFHHLQSCPQTPSRHCAHGRADRCAWYSAKPGAWRHTQFFYPLMLRVRYLFFFHIKSSRLKEDNWTMNILVPPPRGFTDQTCFLAYFSFPPTQPWRTYWRCCQPQRQGGHWFLHQQWPHGTWRGLSQTACVLLTACITWPTLFNINFSLEGLQWGHINLRGPGSRTGASG